jgi:hypothetical protein
MSNTVPVNAECVKSLFIHFYRNCKPYEDKKLNFITLLRQNYTHPIFLFSYLKVQYIYIELR